MNEDLRCAFLFQTSGKAWPPMAERVHFTGLCMLQTFLQRPLHPNRDRTYGNICFIAAKYSKHNGQGKCRSHLIGPTTYLVLFQYLTAELVYRPARPLLLVLLAVNSEWTAVPRGCRNTLFNLFRLKASLN